MATFEAKKLELTQINGGQEYEQGDFLQSDTINDVVEGTAYAQNVAEAANTTSNKAVSTANSANNTANAASAKVDTFDQRITTAQNTADTAVSNAATAQSTADSATTEINKIKNGTTVVPNANHANNADNANMATKAQQDVNGNPINTTYATKEFVTEQQGTRVKVNNANVAELSFTSDPQTQITANKNAIAEAQSDINDIVDGSQPVGKATRDANGNVIDTTYATLSQVVRVDAAQTFTDAQKWMFSKNSRFRLHKEIERSSEWKTVACISNYGQVCMAVSTDLPGSGQLIAKFLLAIGFGSAADITQIGYTTNSPISAIRLRSSTNAKTYVDLQFNANTNIATTVSVYFEPNLTDAYGGTDIQLFDFVDFSGNESDYMITMLNLVNSGINTTGTIYQQGAPVFATDPSKLAPSTANGWTQTTATGTLPSAGVYMIAVHHTPSATQPHHYYNPAILVYDGTSASCIVTDETGRLLVSITVTPSGIRLVNTINPSTNVQSTNIYYKRIA